MSSPIIAPPAYPIDAFPLTLRNLAYEIHQNIQAPDALIGMALMGAVCAVYQALVRVKSPSGGILPITLYQLPISESGNRKTATINCAFKEIIDHDTALVRARPSLERAFNGSLNVWTTEDKALRRRLATAMRIGDDAQIGASRQALLDHGSSKPTWDPPPCILHSDMTSRALLNTLAGNHRSIAIVADEGGVALNSSLLRNLVQLDKVWDGPDVLPLDRADGPVLAAYPLMSMLIAPQPKAFEDFRQRHGELAHGVGFWSRVLIAWPASTMGARWVSTVEPVWVHRQPFSALIEGALAQIDHYANMPDFKPTILELSDAAKAAYGVLANEVEHQLGPVGMYADISDFASKLLEHHLRLAAVLHCAAGDAGKISYDTFMRARAIAGYHLHEFMRILSSRYEPPPWQVDAEKLYEYMWRNIWYPGQSQFAKSILLHRGPVRERNRRDAALKALYDRCALSMALDKKQRPTIVCLNNDYFAAHRF